MKPENIADDHSFLLHLSFVIWSTSFESFVACNTSHLNRLRADESQKNFWTAKAFHNISRKWDSKLVQTLATLFSLFSPYRVGELRILTLSFCAYVCTPAKSKRDLFWISMPIRFSYRFGSAVSGYSDHVALSLRFFWPSRQRKEIKERILIIRLCTEETRRHPISFPIQLSLHTIHRLTFPMLTLLQQFHSYLSRVTSTIFQVCFHTRKMYVPCENSWQQCVGKTAISSLLRSYLVAN